jgi:hypothetical protein
MKKIAMRTSLWAAAALVVGVVMPVVAATQAAAAQPVLSGNWQLVLCLNPDKLCNVTGAGLCAQFTRVPGLVGQLPNSGTWKMSGAGSLVGRWLQNGDFVHFYGPYGGSNNFISFTGMLSGASRLGGISFVDGPVATANMITGTWFATKTASCAPSASRGQSSRLMSDQH